MARGLLTVAAVKARCDIDPITGCWNWTGATHRSGTPSIYTIDYGRADKRTMSGPVAMWNIAHNESPGDWTVFRRCMNCACLNPVHLARAKTRAELGLHITRSGKHKGTNLEQRYASLKRAREARGQTPIPRESVLAIRAAVGESTASLAERHSICLSSVIKIRAGKMHAGVTA